MTIGGEAGLTRARSRFDRVNRRVTLPLVQSDTLAGGLVLLAVIVLGLAAWKEWGVVQKRRAEFRQKTEEDPTDPA
jgi:hypothetical protein